MGGGFTMSIAGKTPDSMTRFVGYLERRPYLWFVDIEARAIEPAAELRDIPQGIDEVVPLDKAVAVRCGPSWFALEPDLSGRGRSLSDTEFAAAKRRSVWVDWPRSPSVYDRELVLPGPNVEGRIVKHPQVAYWQRFGTWAPDRRTIAVAGSTSPFVAPARPILSGPDEPVPSVLALVDVTTGTARVCEGTFDNFCYPPAWSQSGGRVVIGAPFEPKRLYVVRPEHAVLQRVPFRRHVPMPLLDSALLPPS